MATAKVRDKAHTAVDFARKAEQLSLVRPQSHEDEETAKATAVEAKFITASDPVIELASGDRLPAVPLTEAQQLNELKDKLEDRDSRSDDTAAGGLSQEKQQASAAAQRATFAKDQPVSLSSAMGRKEGVPLQKSHPPSQTNPLFPPLPLYGPPSLLRNIQCHVFRVTSFFLSLAFLAVIVLGSAFTSIPLMFKHIGMRLRLKDPDSRRPFYKEEKKRREQRREAEKLWTHDRKRRQSNSGRDSDQEEFAGHSEGFVPTEGGKDPLVCDVRYYARRVGLDIEEFKVQTEDGFIIDLWHVYNPKEYTPGSKEERDFNRPDVFYDDKEGDGGRSKSRFRRGRKYPILMMHGLLQSAGAYCTNDDDSLAFFLAKSGYDVWLGNNRCGFHPQHKLLKYSDPRFWCWNIRQMGVLDLPAFISRVLMETGFPKLGLICHSQGTTQTFVALAKEQRPDLGSKVSVFCALAPAVYAGPLIGKMYFKFMRIISPGMFRIFFGIHAFIPFMMSMHSILPGRLYGALGYRVFSFLFNWSDDRWDLDLRDRLFQFAPVYVSAESMRWWLGRECFAKHRCILATKEEGKQEDVEDEEEGEIENLAQGRDNRVGIAESAAELRSGNASGGNGNTEKSIEERARYAWYDEQAPPMALWVAGSDQLVDGKRLLRRFERGREPFVNIVHSKIIKEYEHLDVLWAIDVIEQVGVEVRDVIWKTAEGLREGCVVPKGCEKL